MSCRKKKYPSEKIANTAAGNLLSQNGWTMYSYKCRVCKDAWHLTSKPNILHDIFGSNKSRSKQMNAMHQEFEKENQIIDKFFKGKKYKRER